MASLSVSPKYTNCAFYESVESCVKPLWAVAKFGLPVATKERQNLLLYLLLAYYVADISDKDDPFAMK